MAGRIAEARKAREVYCHLDPTARISNIGERLPMRSVEDIERLVAGLRLAGMPEMTEQRRLAAVVSADVAGYSRLMGRGESGTLAALKILRQEVVDPRLPTTAAGS
jgi:class 3 adenylate cyclase